MSTDKVKVAVRVRPFNRREEELGTKCVVFMEKNQVILQHLGGIGEKLENRKRSKTFAFDSCFDSIDPSNSEYSSQDDVYQSLGEDILDNAFEGYNACIFAYGQTGSGKSYTMMGSQDNKGIIPRLCDSMFERVSKMQGDNLICKVEVSYMEIYNEKVHDLLDPGGSRQSLKVREHSVLGPYVDGLSQLAVSSYEDIDNLMTEGNKSRTVAATNMNSESSRSHAVFNVILTQILIDSGSGVSGEKVSKLSLVDLAGSERAVKTGAVGERLKEGSNINKSLTTLGLVISKLADQSSNKSKDKFVPYRDSVLTWLLKDNLGGNSKTVMVATISPASDNYEETLSTLRYADRAKRIVNHAVVNEDPNARIIRELRAEVEALKEQLKLATVPSLSTSNSKQREDLHEKLSESEKLMKAMSQTWEEKLQNTERVQHVRQAVLEKMGISVQASGIKVEHGKYYLVNLNEDPSMNELLVYYLKERTLVGSPNAHTEQDIQLSGLGIQPEHCVITIDKCQLFIEPKQNAKTCVNGSIIQGKTVLRHGDRILWGNNHFFKVNCPKIKQLNVNEPQTPSQAIDYKFAQEEIILNELSNDPIQAAIKRLEKQHEEDKQVALEKQKQEYENQLQKLRNIMSPSTPYAPYMPFDPVRSGRNSCNDKWVQDRDEMFRRSLSELREKIVRTKAFVREANFMAEEMEKCTEFGVTLQIPASSLTPCRKRGAFVSEPAILVKRKGKPSQVWSVDKLENKLIDMRELYNEMQLLGSKEQPHNEADPFFESQENHNLIGVANIFLEVLFHDVTLDYHVPIISQQGEVAGRLHVEIGRTSGNIPERFSDITSESSFDLSRSSLQEDQDGMKLTCRIAIKQASGLPLSLSNFVFCQYRFWGCQDQVVVAPVVYPDCVKTKQSKDSMTFKFEHEEEYCVHITEEFIEYCSDGALSIEVWGHRSAGFGITRNNWEMEQQLAKARSLADRWSELTRKIELKVKVQELNDQGEYSAVEVLPRPDILCGGIVQLRQGQQRRIYVSAKPVANSGTLPLICECISSISIGCICGRSSMSKPLDSYHEEDLNLLRTKWSDALMRRRQYLDEQIQKIINKKDKSDADSEREQRLIHQWISLTEERNAVLVPEPGSGIPGAPADWSPPRGLEPHIPVMFLDLNADDLSANSQSSYMLPVVGQNSILPKEHSNEMCTLPILTHYDDEIAALATWDSSLHDNIYLNRVTAANERVYLILKVCVRVSHPATMEIVLRKRLCINIYKKQSIVGSLMKKIAWQDRLDECGVIYEIVSNIPKASEELEDRESLAQIAAESEDTSPLDDGETYIEKYTRGVNALESILTLDKLRQSVAVKELLQVQGRNLMRKTVSVPNISHVLVGDASFDSMIRSESVIDLAAIDANSFKDFHKTSVGSDCAKAFGLARPTFLNLNAVRHQNATKRSAAMKPFQPMKTLHEEAKDKSQIGMGNECLSSDNFNGKFIGLCDNVCSSRSESSDKCGQQPMQETEQVKGPFSVSCDSYQDNSSSNPSLKSGTPASLISSGYGSQAVSITNLSSEDSISLKSISVDDTPESEGKDLCESQAPVMSSSIDYTSDSKDSHPLNVLNELPIFLNVQDPSSLEDLSKISDSHPNDTEDIDSHHCNEDISYEKLPNGLDSGFYIKESNIPPWLVMGESVLIRPYNTPGVVAYIGPTEFAPGLWIGVELFAPTGKNDGSVSGIQYFTCKPKFGLFVRHEKLILDRRGRAMKTHKADKPMRRSVSKVEGLNTVLIENSLKRSVSKSDGLSIVRKSTSRGDSMSSLSK